MAEFIDLSELKHDTSDVESKDQVIYNHQSVRNILSGQIWNTVNLDDIPQEKVGNSLNKNVEQIKECKSLRKLNFDKHDNRMSELIDLSEYKDVTSEIESKDQVIYYDQSKRTILNNQIHDFANVADIPQEKNENNLNKKVKQIKKSESLHKLYFNKYSNKIAELIALSGIKDDTSEVESKDPIIYNDRSEMNIRNNQVHDSVNFADIPQEIVENNLDTIVKQIQKGENLRKLYFNEYSNRIAELVALSGNKDDASEVESKDQVIYNGQRNNLYNQINDSVNLADIPQEKVENNLDKMEKEIKKGGSLRKLYFNEHGNRMAELIGLSENKDDAPKVESKDQVIYNGQRNILYNQIHDSVNLADIPQEKVENNLDKMVKEIKKGGSFRQLFFYEHSNRTAELIGLSENKDDTSKVESKDQIIYNHQSERSILNDQIQNSINLEDILQEKVENDLNRKVKQIKKGGSFRKLILNIPLERGECNLSKGLWRKKTRNSKINDETGAEIRSRSRVVLPRFEEPETVRMERNYNEENDSLKEIKGSESSGKFLTEDICFRLERQYTRSKRFEAKLKDILTRKRREFEFGKVYYQDAGASVQQQLRQFEAISTKAGKLSSKIQVLLNLDYKIQSRERDDTFEKWKNSCDRLKKNIDVLTILFNDPSRLINSTSV